MFYAENLSLVIEPGFFEVMVGTSARSTKKATFEVVKDKLVDLMMEHS